MLAYTVSASTQAKPSFSSAAQAALFFFFLGACRTENRNFAPSSLQQ